MGIIVNTNSLAKTQQPLPYLFRTSLALCLIVGTVREDAHVLMFFSGVHTFTACQPKGGGCQSQNDKSASVIFCHSATDERCSKLRLLVDKDR